MNAAEYVAILRERWLQGTPEPPGTPPYFSAEGKRLRREAVKRAPVDRGEPVAGTGKHKYHFPKHFDCFGECICKSNRTKRERNAFRYEEKANY